MKKLFALGLGIIFLAAGCNKPAPIVGKVFSGSTEIDITGTGFSPSTITVKSGTQVIFKNSDTNLHRPASNPHPTHTDLPGFDALHDLASGETYSFTFSKVGTWGFHDHLNPLTYHGSIVVVP